MTNINEEREAESAKKLLLDILKSTTEAEIPAELQNSPRLIAENLIYRFRTLKGADESVSQLMELAAELAKRGDRWKRVAKVGFDLAQKHSEDDLSTIFAREYGNADAFPAGEMMAKRVVKSFEGAVANGGRIKPV